MSKSPRTLWYTNEAANWNEALPIGKGRIGLSRNFAIMNCGVGRIFHKAEV